MREVTGWASASPRHLKLSPLRWIIVDMPNEKTEPYILRTHRPGDMGWIIHRQAILYNEEQGWNEQFEANVAKVAANFLKNFDPECERCWIAERDGEIVGSILCVRRSETEAQLRLLYVEPSARGLGLGNRLVDECIRFARSVGYEKIVLWTNTTLKAARHIYEREGFKIVSEEPHETYGPPLLGQTWERAL